MIMVVGPGDVSPERQELHRQYDLAVRIYQGLDEKIRQLVHDMYKLNRNNLIPYPGTGLRLLNRENYLEAMKPALMFYHLWPSEDHPDPLSDAAQEYEEIIQIQEACTSLCGG